MKVLIIEDERDLAEAMSAVFKKNNISSDIALDGEYGLDCAMSGIYDVVVLDILLPKLDGLAVLAEMRSSGLSVPVLLLTALGGIDDKVAGLDRGADDYLAKPFHMQELLARLRALARRKSELLYDGIISIGCLSFNPQTLCLSDAKGRQTRLTLKESQLLELLYSYRDGILPKEEIILKLWGYDANAQDSNVESQVSLLRKKLIEAKSDAAIKAVRGAGYRLEAKGRQERV
ncbi:MAG: response regulator transcription factor [Eubacteriaceae bacterium]|nr:response regulator transcription factor [Eubacteriaceae bacterium]